MDILRMTMYPIDEKQRLCLECLECCHYLEFGINLPRWIDYGAISHFYETRGCKTKLVSKGKLREVFILVPYRCPHLSPTGCLIYKDRPEVCRKYDGRRDVMIAEKCKWKELKE
jgi:Fe-S-cluster containining protein